MPLKYAHFSIHVVATADIFILPYLQANKLSCLMDADRRIRPLDWKQGIVLFSGQQAA